MAPSVTSPTLQQVVNDRMRSKGLSRHQLTQQIGYTNVSKGLRRLDAYLKTLTAPSDWKHKSPHSMEVPAMLFENVSVDPDTRILHHKEIMIDTLPVLIQAWAWEGIVAESAIFRADDVRGFSDEELFRKIVDN